MTEKKQAVDMEAERQRAWQSGFDNAIFEKHGAAPDAFPTLYDEGFKCGQRVVDAGGDTLANAKMRRTIEQLSPAARQVLNYLRRNAGEFVPLPKIATGAGSKPHNAWWAIKATEELLKVDLIQREVNGEEISFAINGE